jgi:hypothetical protein
MKALESRHSNLSQPAAFSSRRWSPWDFAGILLGCLLAAAVSLRLGDGRVFWEDEMLGWMMIHDPSWRHMIAAWNLGADGGGFSFYFTGRLWFWLFGASSVAFRMYSGACFALAFGATWIAARRFYRPLPVAFALFTAWFFSPALVPHIGEGRFYGLLMAGVALATLVYVSGVDIPRSTWRLCLAAFLVHSLLVTSHILGIVYSGFLLLATFLLDRLRRQWRPALYACEIAAWAWLIPSRHAILASAAVGKPHFWIVQPSFSEFIVAYSAFSLRIAALLVLLALLVSAGFLFFRHSRRPALADAAPRIPAYVLIGIFLLIPIAFFLEGEVATPLFVPRYLVPLNIGIAFLLAELVTLAAALFSWPRFASRLPVKLLLAAAALAYTAVLLVYDLNYLGRFMDQQPDYTAALTAQLPRGIPIVCQDAFSFTELMAHENNSGVDYMYLLDWPDTIRPHAPLLGITQYHLMENWKKAGYFSNRIQYRRDFLEHTPEFLVLDAARFRPSGLASSADIVPLTAMMGVPLQRLLAGEGFHVSPWKVVTAGTVRGTLSLVCRDGSPCRPPA